MKLYGILALAVLLTSVACSQSEKRGLTAKGNPSIIGGAIVKKDSFLARSTVGIFDAQSTMVCTGVLLENNLILTAAHCVVEDLSELFIVFSPDMESLLKNSDMLKKSPLTRRVSKAVAHPDFNQTILAESPAPSLNDIGLMKFNGTTPKGYLPAKILPNMKLLIPGSETLIAGYGVETDNVVEVDVKDTENLKELEDMGLVVCEIDAKDNSKHCFAEEMDGPAILKSTSVVIENLPNTHEVIVRHDNQHGPCSGDSGGPAYLKMGNDYYVWGIVSRSLLGCSTTTTYTNVLSFNSWIKQQSAVLLKSK
ncbi:trypsin-like serine protease [Bdellovibrio sp. SKB1291214]|uniref:S1 family peptidase n=1 Tax=Bdellovibrio sp. SKB1291214 TaxID=1732569 RepID=UPI000B51A758|nr:trypsin-like serine protease [Bdellovibrio sp. SKB1291214]UYL08368.1 trypsin-like serine protease [Bdellovibrio sp. SKB1291214]